MGLFNKNWKITFSEPIGRFGKAFELEDWVEFHKRLSSAFSVENDKSYSMLETKLKKVLCEAAESRSDYQVVKRQFQVTDRNGKSVPSEECAFLFLKGDEANLQLLLIHVNEDSGDYYRILAFGDKKIVDFIRNSVPKVFMIPIHGVLRWLGKWSVDAVSGKATGLLIHAGEAPTLEPRLYLAVALDVSQVAR
jgi:hypothetical protein